MKHTALYTEFKVKNTDFNQNSGKSGQDRKKHLIWTILYGTFDHEFVMSMINWKCKCVVHKTLLLTCFNTISLLCYDSAIIHLVFLS